MKARTVAWIASLLWIALIVLCVVWEVWLAPLRPEGSWLMLKAAPLLVPLFGLLHGRRYTYQWGCMFVLLYFMEGVVRMNDPGGVALLARIEIVLTVAAFVVMMWYARMTAPSRQAKAE
ncbi:DUF2069 domain-containing protein [Denitromonas iodatirespirans]|uniref:DUF2069 domain-containing protein n=1 Tax=Denitromonas iodatirespirans TaxID=2795389 RepID=A0A944DKG0_DENI1|nr:DUF2069 domain-containing protein [Denitromonas iodatirespirans]MBT0960409.1 DUF2069 domain-containing protein [Denitromonas iodatirespirans]